jgi:hypothetical protein
VKEKQRTTTRTEKRGECESEREMGRMAMTTIEKKSVCMCVCVKEKQGTKTRTQNRRECESERRRVLRTEGKGREILTT